MSKPVTAEKFKKKTFTEDFLKKQKKEMEFLNSRIQDSEYEKELYEKFLRGVEEHFKDPNVPRKFHLKHVFDLNINWDILFLYSKKDVGKTWQIVDYINAKREQYPQLQVCYIRNTKEELKALNQQFREDRWPLYLKTDWLYWKDPRRPHLPQAGDKPAGFVAYPSGASGFRKWQGANHEHVKVVVWDECNSIAGGLTLQVIRDFQIFLSSIIRDKKDVKTFMFGNHLKANNIFLESLNLESDTRLKVITSPDGLSTLLYLNTGDLYEGIESQKGLPTQFIGSSGNDDLYTNKPQNWGNKNIYKKFEFFMDLDPLKAIVFPSRKFASVEKKIKHYILYMAKDRTDTNKIGLWMEEYTESNLKMNYKAPICCDNHLVNQYEYVKFVEERVIGSIVRKIGRWNKAGKIWYGKNDTCARLEEVWPELWAIAKRTDPHKDRRRR